MTSPISLHGTTLSLWSPVRAVWFVRQCGTERVQTFMTPWEEEIKRERHVFNNLICKAEMMNTLMITDNPQIFLDYLG